MTFESVLFKNPDHSVQPEREAPTFFRDRNLDRITGAVTAGRQEYDLAPLFHAQLKDLDSIAYGRR